MPDRLLALLVIRRAEAASGAAVAVGDVVQDKQDKEDGLVRGSEPCEP